MSCFMVIVALSTFISLGIVFGAVFGSFESEEVIHRSNIGNNKKLPHGWLLLARLLVCLVFALMVTDYELRTLFLTGVMFVALTITHRVVFNRGIGKPYWYMGPAERSNGDSVYDALIRFLTNKLLPGSIGEKKEAAFMVAVTIEALCLIGLAYWFAGSGCGGVSGL